MILLPAIACAAAFLAVAVAIGIRQSTTNQFARLSNQNCLAIENLKAGQREQAQATVDGDNALLKEHPNGLPGFPASVILADRAAKQKTVDRYPPKECP